MNALPSGTDLKDVAVVRRSLSGSLGAYIRTADPFFTFGRLHDRLVDLAQQIEAGVLRRVIINTPPRHGKSRMFAVEFPAWLLGRDPRRKIMAASYSGYLSSRHSMECMARVSSGTHRLAFPGCRLMRNKQAADDWMTTAWGGYTATSVTGSTTGMGADLLIVDDPVKDFSEAHSPTMREKVWQWYLSTALTRLSPTGAIVIIMTRWHEDDLAGRLLNPQRQAELEEAGGSSEKFEVFNFPALAPLDGTDILARAPGEALFPEKFTTEFLRARRAALGSYLWSALYCGDPQVKGGNYCDVTKIKIISPEDLPAGLGWVRFWDLAADGKSSSDYTAGGKVAFMPDGGMVIGDVTRGKWIWPKARERMKQIAISEGIEVGVEAVAGFKTSYANFVEVLPPNIRTREIGVDKDKLTRANPWFALADNGLLYLVRGEWNGEFIKEVSAFPGGTYDDQVDCISGAYSMIFNRVRIMVA